MTRAAAIILLCSVLLLFFVPATAGPFSAVHGPATALRANRAAQMFYFHLAFSARNPITALIFSLQCTLSPLSYRTLLIDRSAPPSALRC